MLEPLNTVVKNGTPKLVRNQERSVYFILLVFSPVLLIKMVAMNQSKLVQYRRALNDLVDEIPHETTDHHPTINIDKTSIDKQRNLSQALDSVMPPLDEPIFYCSPWEVNVDDWWQSHPDWEPAHGYENDTHTCFHPISNPARATFYRQVYETQYSRHNCSEMYTRNQIPAGYAGTINYLMGAFWGAHRDGMPFQVTKHWSGFRWLYVPPYNLTLYNNTDQAWATCPSEDFYCYFLPVSNCPRPHRKWEPKRPKPHFQMEVDQDPVQREKFMWLRHYLTRPRQHVRHRLYKLMKQQNLQLNQGTPCTWMHVRRADAMTEKQHARNFYWVQDYLTRGNISKGETILLFTDDNTTIEEVQGLHPDYNWLYWKRYRHRGEAKWSAHLPSNNGGHEILVILAEIELAGQCRKGVHGTSNLVDMFRDSMVIHQPRGLSGIELIQIDEELKKTRVPAKDFLRELDAKLEAARKK